MAVATDKFPVLVIAFGLFSHHVSVVVSSQCVDGTYEHDGRDCCLCPPGQHLVEHCTTNLEVGKCDPCDPGTYSSHPTAEMSCDLCTSCSQPSENLEEDEPCTVAQDRKCRCQKDHYCVSSTDICRLCHRCKQCGTEGIKVPCAGHNDTVCNDKIEGGVSGGKITGIVFAVIVIIAIGGLAVFFFKKRRRQQPQAELTNGNATDVERQNLRVSDVDLQPLLPDIAEVIGWKDMQDVAMRSGMLNATIDACKLDHPGDSQEQTLQLLRIWQESQGREAGLNLIESLGKSGKKSKAGQVRDILLRGS
ncbi:tumor necrosis factor receptor superfamily member 6 [Chelmon rostratus]|uniref:tumor necrosis factor receptor superfamily member 6 n=1 Tax=Chelmon rostratus TaxID=109905 RepID=UPI001BECAFF5|nr:tumor necrosis factor receptor superfamily member 6 [Chelmon rostratus]